MDRFSGQTFGHSRAKWQSAKEEAVSILRARARNKETISYKEFCATLNEIKFTPHETPLFNFLGEIAKEEFPDCGALLTALVVRQEDGMPGTGFFELGDSLDLDVRDKELFWTSQVKSIFAKFER